MQANKKAEAKQEGVEQKIDELIDLLAKSDFDSDTARQYKQKLDDAIESKIVSQQNFEAFKVIDEKGGVSRDELLEEFSMLLISNKVDSRFSSKYLKAESTNKVIVMLIGLLMIVLGMAMIIMPAPPYFEMFTIFYFTRDDGVTLMDLISLGIVFSGVYLFIRSLYKKPSTQSKND